MKSAVKFDRKSIKTENKLLHAACLRLGWKYRQISFLRLLLWSSTRMISLSSWGGVLWMAVWTERSSTDKASLTKMKMMLSWGRSEEYDMFLHLRRERDGGRWRGQGVGGRNRGMKKITLKL